MCIFICKEFKKNICVHYCDNKSNNQFNYYYAGEKSETFHLHLALNHYTPLIKINNNASIPEISTKTDYSPFENKNLEIKKIDNSKKLEANEKEKVIDKTSHEPIPRKPPWVYKKNIKYANLNPLKCVQISRNHPYHGFQNLVFCITENVHQTEVLNYIDRKKCIKTYRYYP